MNIGAGGVLAVDAPVLTVPLAFGASTSIRSPVSDITFSASGTRMFLAERSMQFGGVFSSNPTWESYNHYSRVHIADLAFSVWTVTKSLDPGCYRSEAYGGVTLGPENGLSEEIVWMTSADMQGAPGPHGLFGVRPGGFPTPGPAPTSKAYRVPFDPAYNSGGPDFKGSGGDIEIMPALCCVKIDNKLVECINTNKTYEWQFCVTNCWNQGIKYLSFLDLPPGLDINEDIVMLPSVLPPGQGLCLTNYFTNTAGLTNLCFTVGAHTTNLLECCSVTNCLTLAPCCLYLTSEKLTPIFMIPPMGNCYNYTFTVKNVASPPLPLSYLLLVQDPMPPPSCISFTPNLITFSPPLLPNQSMTKTVKVCLTPSKPCKGPFYFLAGAHNSNLVECCSTRHCLPKAMFCHPVDIPIDDVVFRAGTTITVPVVIDRSIVQPQSVTLSDGTNVIASIANPAEGQSDNIFTLSVTWSNAPVGMRMLMAELIDTLGGVWNSESVTLHVLEAAPPNQLPLAPPLQNPRLEGGNVKFSLATEPGVTCHVEYTESLSPPDWKVLRTIVGDGSRMTVTDSLTNAPQRFYRVRVTNTTSR